MALTRQQKETRIAQASKDLSQATAVVFMAYDALPASDTEELRGKLHAEGVAMRVLPKRLLKKVLEQAKIEFDPLTHEGQLAILWGSDATAPARILHQFAKKHEQVRLVGGLLEGALLELARVESLAVLPSRQELLGQLVGTIAGPLRGLQAVLTGVPRKSVYVLAAIAKKKQTAYVKNS